MAALLSFCGNPLDRAGNRRADAAWLAQQRARSDARFLPFWGLKPGVRDDRADFVPWREDFAAGLCIFLGLEGDAPRFAVQDLSADEPPGFEEMRAAAFILPAADTAMAGQGRALIDWHTRHRFCPNCGAETAPADGGWKRVCAACAAEHFPRTDPVVIMLPVFSSEEGDDACLVGRSARFPEGMVSAFAGFVEPGESLEEAVRRELAEEVNVKVGAIRYHASQPWPFPSSLMLGCYAQALSKDFAIDGREIEAAQWMTKTELRVRLAGTLDDAVKLPGTIAIAWHLLRDWAAE